MTYGELKNQISMLLISDNQLPKDDNKIKSALKMTYIEMADLTTPLKWVTLDNGNDVIRLAFGNNYYLRMPILPEVDSDVLDIDKELVPVVARIMAGYIAKEINVRQYHRSLAMESMKRYDSKVREYMISLQSAENPINMDEDDINVN